MGGEIRVWCMEKQRTWEIFEIEGDEGVRGVSKFLVKFGEIGMDVME